MTTSERTPTERAPERFVAPTWRTPRELREWIRQHDETPDATTPRRRLTWLEDLAALLVLASVCAWIGWRTGDFRGFPKGYDDFGHLSYVSLLQHSFPHIQWNAAWYSGTRGIPGIYGPAYHLLVLAAATVTGGSLGGTMVALTAVFMMATIAGAYSFVRIVTTSRIAALISGLVLLATPALWEQSLIEGEYARLLAITCTSIAMALAAWYVSSPTRRRLILVIIALSVSLLSHQEGGVVGVITVTCLLTFTPTRPLRDRLTSGLAALVATCGAVAFFYLPQLPLGIPTYLQDPGSALSLVRNQPLSLNILFGFHAPQMTGMAFLCAPLAVVAVLVVCLEWTLTRHSATRRPGLPTFPVTLALLVAPAAIALYSLVDLSPKTQWNLSSIKPAELVIFLSLSAAPLIGLGVAVIERSLPRLVGAGVDLMVVALVVWLLAYVVAGLPPALNGKTPEQRALAALLPPEAHGTQAFRIGGLTDDITSWINADTTTPQIRGYINQQNLHLDWQYWLETSLTNPSLPLAQREYFFNWWSIKWMYVGPGLSAQAPYLDEPHTFASVGSTTAASPYQLVQYQNPEPIASATSAPTVLVITPDHTTYDYFLRQTGLAGQGPTTVIPVEGDRALDEYSVADLRHFTAVAIYGTTPITNAPHVAATLRAYANGGGHVLLEADGNEATLAAVSAVGGPIPVSLIGVTSLGGSWHFVPSSTLPTQSRRQLTAFSPPNVGGGLWNVDTGLALHPGTQTLLRSSSHVVVARLGVGQGEITWSGLNLPYHSAISKVSAEASFNLSLLNLPSATSAPASSAHLPLNGPITVRAPRGSSGVLVKESLTPNWTATINGRSATVYPAGPGFMYVPLSTAQPATVTLSYRLTMVQSVGLWVSVVSAGILALGLLLPWGLIARVWRRRQASKGLVV